MNKYLVSFCFLPFVIYSSSWSGFSQRANQYSQCEEYCVDPHRPDLNSKNWFSTLEVLYWKVDETKLDYAVTRNQSFNMRYEDQLPFPFGNAAPLTNGGMFIGGNVHSAEFDANPGLRVEFGKHLCTNEWTLSGQYTYVSAAGFSSAKRGDGPYDWLNGTLTSFTQVGNEKGSSRILLNYQVLDLLFKKDLYLGRGNLLSLFIAPRGAYLHQRWRIVFDPIDTYAGSFQGAFATQYLDYFRWKFIGGGLRAGADLDWYFGCGFGIVIEASVSGLYGEHKSSHRGHEGLEHQNWVNVKEHSDRFVWSSELAIKLAWNHYRESSEWGLFIGYEANTWYNVHEDIRVSSLDSLLWPNSTNPMGRTIETGPVNIHGLIAGFHAGF